MGKVLCKFTLLGIEAAAWPISPSLPHNLCHLLGGSSTLILNRIPETVPRDQITEEQFLQRELVSLPRAIKLPNLYGITLRIASNITLLIDLHTNLQLAVVPGDSSVIEAPKSLRWGSCGTSTMTHNIKAFSESEGSEPEVAVLKGGKLFTCLGLHKLFHGVPIKL